jgi:transmembrane sensor
MLQQRLSDLFERYYFGTASADEMEELKKLLKHSGDEDLFLLLDDAWKKLEHPDPAFASPDPQALQDIFDNENSVPVEEGNSPVKVISFYQKRWLRYAAILLLTAGTVGYFYFSSTHLPKAKKMAAFPSSPAKEDVLPGGFKATLKLGDGSTVVLSPDRKGLITRQGGTNVFLDGGNVSYQKANKSTAIVFNTMSTPRGGQYRLKLSDGTLVWLNAASSITYPTEFIGASREVSITGEVFFEVTRNSRAPFRIRVNPETRIEVLGTSLNVDSYSDESSIRTTLVNGAVRVNANGTQQLMQPGQQFQVYRNGENHMVNGADVQQIIAWKNGTFNFQRMGLDAVMRQLSRWYDVEIVYPEGVPDIKFGGKVQNTLSLQAMLEGLHAMGVHFRIDGKKVIVTD